MNFGALRSFVTVFLSFKPVRISPRSAERSPSPPPKAAGVGGGGGGGGADIAGGGGGGGAGAVVAGGGGTAVAIGFELVVSGVIAADGV